MSLPSGPDPAVVFKYVKIGGIVVIVLLLLLVLKAIFTGGRSSPPAQTTATPSGPVITLVAVRAVQVTVARPSLEDPEKDGEIIYSKKLSAGETKVVPRTGALFITAVPAGNLDLDVNGRRSNLGQILGPGVDRGKLEKP
jgi:hypothetical protein